ncbi:hypothetical protein AB0N07_50125, partial [Streptomyces sp. NPDC051172]|uniref:hypothetical protein n=1 Tax=Streptomyces sp. NPDC051172 TaxID=3155796 RepID=UPI0034176442
EERELGARQRVEALREEADRVLAALRDAELAWERFVITRETLDEVLAPSGEPGAAESSDVVGVTPRPAAGPVAAGSVVPAWREGLGLSSLSADYQRMMTVLSDRERNGEDEALACKELTRVLGLGGTAAKREGVRSRANRLVARGWLVKDAKGRFRLAQGVRGGGS